VVCEVVCFWIEEHQLIGSVLVGFGFSGVFRVGARVGRSFGSGVMMW
jgi:hypothetical protein